MRARSNVPQLNVSKPSTLARDLGRAEADTDERILRVDQTYRPRYRRAKDIVTAGTPTPRLRLNQITHCDTRTGNILFNLPKATAADAGLSCAVFKRFMEGQIGIQTVDGSFINHLYQRMRGMTQIGIHVFDWDGTGWMFKEPVARTRLPEATPDTVGLWNMTSDNLLGDTSGNGFTLTVETGTERRTRLDANLHGFYFDGSTALWHNVSEAALRITGDFTFLCFWVNHTAVTNARIVSHQATGELEADNTLYAMGWATYPQTTFISESGAGVDASYTEEGLIVMPGQLSRLGCSRESGVVRFWQQGKGFGEPSTALTTPTGGSSGRFRLGGGSAVRANGAMAGAHLIGRALSEQEIRDDFHATMGMVHGFQSEAA